jgi:hypothetical protein
MHARHFGHFHRGGALLSGFVVIKFGIIGILTLDGASFILFGLAMFFSRARIANVFPKENNPQSSLSGRHNVKIALILISVFVLFSNWEQSSSVATASKITLLQIDYVSALRALFSGLGVIAGVLISRYFIKLSYRFWVATIFVLTVGVFLCAGRLPIQTSYILFFGGGLVSCLALPVRKEIYRSIDSAGGDHNKVVSYQLVYNAALSFSLLPIGYLADSSALSINALQISVGTILITGLLGGSLIYLGLKEAVK